MRSVKMVPILLMLICLLTYQVTTGQSDYVVTSKGDTIMGKVKYLNYGVEQKVQVATTDGKKNVYSILQTLAFSQENDVYNPVRTLQGYTYMKVLKTGYLSFYAFQLPDQTRWDGRYLLKKDGTGMEVPNINFKKLISRFLSDCEDVANRVAAGEWSKTEVELIVDAYNLCIQSNTINQNKVIVKLSSWDQLEKEVKNLPPFESKTDALEMIGEIKLKIEKKEKVPNFLTAGLQDSLKDQTSIQKFLEKALSEVK